MDLNNWSEHNQQLTSKSGQAQMDSDLLFFLKRLNFHFLGFIYTRRKNQKYYQPFLRSDKLHSLLFYLNLKCKEVRSQLRSQGNEVWRFCHPSFLLFNQLKFSA